MGLLFTNIPQNRKFSMFYRIFVTKSHIQNGICYKNTNKNVTKIDIVFSCFENSHKNCRYGKQNIQ